jgi:hypothetical protein
MNSFLNSARQPDRNLSYFNCLTTTRGYSQQIRKDIWNCFLGKAACLRCLISIRSWCTLASSLNFIFWVKLFIFVGRRLILMVEQGVPFSCILKYLGSFYLRSIKYSSPTINVFIILGCLFNFIAIVLYGADYQRANESRMTIICKVWNS